MKRNQAFNKKPGHYQQENCDWCEFSDFIGSSNAVKQVRDLMQEYAEDKRGKSVLITGERGTGKEMIACILHHNSVYTSNKNIYIHQDCGALHTETINSTLFGHTSGSFTGANRDRDGCFMAAQNGSLFLDEIGNLPLSVQPMLLRAIEYRKIIPLGTDADISFNARLIFATNKNLRQLCTEGKFMPDLLDRLNRHRIHIPSLRERKDDIPVLTNHFAEKFWKEFELDFDVKISDEVYKKLMTYDFPGNVRELDNILDIAVDQMRKAKEKVLKGKHITFDIEQPFANDFGMDIKETPPDRSKDGDIPGLLEINRPLWEGKCSNEAPCLIKFNENEKETLLNAYRIVRNKALLARLLGLTVDQLRWLK